MTQKVLLIADDQEDNRVIFAAILMHHGYGVFIATNGREAVELAGAHSPRLILMDLQMPVMDGWEATRLLRSDPGTAHIPIIAVTAEDHGDPRRLQETGFCAYIRKPVLPQNMARAVEFCLEVEARGVSWITLPNMGSAPPAVEH